MSETQVEEMLGDYYWANVFAYAGEVAEDNRYADGTGPPARVGTVVGSESEVTPFGRSDIAELYGSSDGENDQEDWVCYGLLKDGRYFSVHAGCYYTGWG